MQFLLYLSFDYEVARKTHTYSEGLAVDWHFVSVYMLFLLC